MRVLPPRGERPTADNDRIWRVTAIRRDGDTRQAALAELDGNDTTEANIDDLVVVAEFRDPIYPGLVSTGKVERGGDKPFHTVINAENFHALQTLLFTHRGKVDCIYIDPPYNTGAKDWKYNNDYVEGDDIYRHSKWLAFMERRLLLAKELLNPDNSVLLVAIDEKEVHRLGLLLEQTFPVARMQMVTAVTSQRGVTRDGATTRVDEYIYVLLLGDARLRPLNSDLLGAVEESKPRQMWFQFRRNGSGSRRADSPNLFYPLLVDPATNRIHEVGEPLPLHQDRNTVEVPDGLVAVWPLRTDGSEARWKIGAPLARRNVEHGYLRVGGQNPKTGLWSVLAINEGAIKDIESGEIEVDGRDPDTGAVIVTGALRTTTMPKSVWNSVSHDAGWHGSRLLSWLLPGRSFPFPKSLYAVEDALRMSLGDNKNALVLDFFAGSGTTAHAVMRLNRQDQGNRRSILVTNNEVAADEQRALRKHGLRAGDDQWERLGICDYITKPRIAAAITGRTPEDVAIDGDYKFADEFPIAEGFTENVEFFTLTYEAPLRVASHREFARIAPLLWLRAGSRGRRIEDVSSGWDVADVYGVIADLDRSDEFLDAVATTESVTMVFVVTDEDRLWEAIVAELPERVEPVRLYEAYLRNFEIEAGRSAR